MRDTQVATFLETWNGFRRGLISSSKPNVQQTLSQILESNVSEKYFLSPLACKGILRRADKRGKALPPMLYQALLQVAQGVERTGETRGQDPVVAVAHVATMPTLRAGAANGGAGHGARSGDSKDEYIVPVRTLCIATGQAGAEIGADMSPTLNCNHEAPYAVIPINDMATRHAGTDGSGNHAGKGHGLGIGSATDPMFTLTKGDKHAVAYSFDSLASNSMKSSNPESGCRVVEITKTLDTSSLDPSCNQGGIGVLSVAYSTKLHNTTSNGAGKFYENYTASLDANSPPPAVAFVQNSRDEVRLMGGDGGIVGALAAETGAKQQCYVAAFKDGQGASAGGIGYDEHVSPTLSAADSGSNRTPALMQGMAVRRLMPVECERLQGFPDNWTDVPHRGKPAADGNRYKALGNSWAVPVAAWVGKRIQEVEAIAAGQAAA